MPIEFTQYPSPENTGVSGDTLYKMAMAYDGSGRRISKTRWVKAQGDVGWSRGHVTHYTGIGTEVRENLVNNETKVVVNMPQGLGRYGIEDADHAAESGSAQTFEWFLKNNLGSTMLVYGTGGTSGGLKAAYDYRSFGEQIELTSPSTGKVTENFTGKEHDDEIALDYFGARYLDPMLGMWISVDPKREYFSPYIYLRGNPINLIDPTGMAEAAPEIAKISPEAANYINSFVPTKHELKTFIKTYDRFVGLTEGLLSGILKNTYVKYGGKGGTNERNGYYNPGDDNQIYLTSRAIEKGPEMQMRIRSTIFHELAHYLNYMYGKTLAEGKQSESGNKVEVDESMKPYPNEVYPQKGFNAGSEELGKQFEKDAYGKDY